jgi:CheY-like chemotaxis protein
VESPQKLAFVIQAHRLQGLVWQSLLKSQSLAVILEPSRTDLVDCISQIAEAGLTLPDLIILDTEISDINPYEFCRWCRQRFPCIQIFLTRTHRGPIAETERRWAMQQGASGFLHGFHRETLMSAAAASMRLILASLDAPFLDEKALLSVLLNIRRQMSQSAPSTTALTPAKLQESYTTANGNGNGASTGKRQSTANDGSDLFNDISWVAAGLRALNPRNGSSETNSPAPPFAATPEIPPSTVPSSDIPAVPEATPKTRRYRGVVY